MRRFVNGEEVTFDPALAEARRVGDRLMVQGSDGSHSALAVARGNEVLISYRGGQFRVARRGDRVRRESAGGAGEFRAPMPGQVVDVRAAEGDTVSKGDVVLVLEAMKTQQPFVAPFDGVVTALPVAKGDQVGEGQLLGQVSAEE